MQPTVEILLAAYNGERFLREQLDSLLAQTWEAWRLTVSDDGSTDGTPALLDEYAAKYPDRIRRVGHEGRFGNARDHFFWLMKECTASYMMFCDQDDVWHPFKVEKTMRALLKAEAEAGADVPTLVFTDLTPTDEKLRPIAPSLMKMQKQYAEVIDYRSLLMQNIVTGCAMGMNQSLALLAGQCADFSQVIMHDWWLGVVAARFGRVVYLDESTMLYRQHGGNSVGAKDAGSVKDSLRTFSHIDRLRGTIAAKKRQADAYLQTYGGLLKPEELPFLHGFLRERSGPAFYWRYRSLLHPFFRL
ncbi:MAG: glycosyltransferase family 2 protein, partial [bacterium]|nr:glycosyltransferase family 2 protein [bacterium]